MSLTPTAIGERVLRCAIYTRKSNEERHNAQFTSLENQREYCSAYIKSQAGQGWTELLDPYEDNGFSGGTLVRPALTRLRNAITKDQIDVVIVYKIDRLSRSLRDFANLVAEFETKGVTFVSVTQSFDTGNSMGRLTLNVLLSFAQFEREVTGERLRDWFAGARARGLWVPNRPYGYDKVDGNNLVPNPIEALVIKRIFELYCRYASCRRVADDLFAGGIMGKSGRPWSSSMINHTIKHRVYLGEIVHRRQGIPGHHEAIVSQRLWRRANKVFNESKWTARQTVTSPVRPLLRGLAYDRTGHRLHHTFMHAKGKLYRYYIAGSERLRYGKASDAFMRFRAEELEHAVLEVIDRMAGITRPSDSRQQQERIEMARRYIDRIDIGLDNMRICFRTGAIVEAEAKGRLGLRYRRGI